MHKETKAVEVKAEDPKPELNVEKLSYRQLQAELKRESNRSYPGESAFVMGGVNFGDSKKRNNAGLSNAFTTVLAVVHENTETAKVFEFHANGNPKRFARKDQIGPGKMKHYIGG